MYSVFRSALASLILAAFAAGPAFGAATFVAHWDGPTGQNQDFPVAAEPGPPGGTPNSGIRAGGNQGPTAPVASPALGQPGFGGALDATGGGSYFHYVSRQDGTFSDFSTVAPAAQGTMELFIQIDPADYGPGFKTNIAMWDPELSDGGVFSLENYGFFLSNFNLGVPPLNTGDLVIAVGWGSYDDAYNLNVDISSWDPNDWHHLAMTWDQNADAISFWVDGQWIASEEYSGTANPPSASLGMGEGLRIAGAGTFQTNDGFLDARLDELIVFDTVEYTVGQNFVPRTTPIVVGPGPLLPGDADNSGTVTADDLIAVQQNFGNVGPIGDGTDPGDANDDGTVTADDLISVQQNFGATLGAAGGAVPEPASLALLAVLAVSLSNRGGLIVGRRK